MTRSGPHYYNRPRVGTSARVAWDWFAKDGEIKSIRLLGGCWECERPDGTFAEAIEALVVLQWRIEANAERLS